MKAALSLLGRQHDLVLSMTEAGVITHLNERPEAPRLVRSPTPIGQHMTDALAPALVAAIATALPQLGVGESDDVGEGDLTSAPIQVISARDASGWVVCVDVDEAAAQAEARVLLERMRVAGHSAALFDAQGRLLELNDVARAKLGEEVVAMLGTPDEEVETLQLVDREGWSIERAMRPIPRALRAGEATQRTLLGVICSRTLRTSWLEVTAVLVHDAQQRAFVTCDVLDVTAQHNAREVLLHENELLQQIIQASPTGIAVFDPSGRITFANDAACLMTGRDASILNNKRYNSPRWARTTLDGEPWRDDEHPFAQVMATQQPVLGVRYMIGRPDGERIAVSMDASPVFNGRGEITQVIAVVTDITEQIQEAKRREKHQRKLHELARVGSLSLMAGGVAHDFNNHLVGMLGAAHVLQTELGPAHPAAEYADLIVQSASEASAITRQLLAYSGRGSFRVCPVDLAQILRDTEPLVRGVIARGVQLDLGFDDVPLVRGDASQLRQLALNLAHNAAQALHGEGVISLRTGMMQVQSADALPGLCIGDPTPGTYTTLRVTDSGVGMDAETLQRSVEPFFSTTPNARGLGLSATLGVVRAHDGFLSIQSTPGSGTSVLVGLPVCVECTQPTEVSLVEEDLSHLSLPRTVLVVDDEPVVRRLLVRVLERSGCVVYTAEDGVDAIRAFSQHHGEIDAVVMDLMMPRMGGARAAETLRAMSPTLPVLFVSGYADEVLPELGAPMAFLPKPFSPHTLDHALRHIAGNIKETVHA